MKACSLIRQGERETAHDELTAAQRIAEAIGSRRMLWQILFALSELERERGDFASAQTLHQRAREIVESIAAHAPDELGKTFFNMPEVRPLLNDRSQNAA